MEIQLVRHATLWIKYGGTTILVDPMFGSKGEQPPIPNTENDRRNPLTPLPGDIGQWQQPDIIIITHLHPDHWDEAARRSLNKSIPVICQPGDRGVIAAAGFELVIEVEDAFSIRGITLHRTGGQHGTGEIGLMMGNVSGFVLEAEGEEKLYIAGDTIWCDEVRAALDAHRPAVTVVNAGGARFLSGDAITMEAEDVIAVALHAPYTRIAAVHMDSINHCLVTREKLSARLAEESLLDVVNIPADGEWL
ncbi:MBL fold metallo-hydrolase [Paenibacillus sp. CAU 1782]